MGKNVLVVDLDPQGNATAGLGIDRKSVDCSIYEVLFGGKNLQNIIVEASCGVHLAPSSVDLLATETHMAGIPNQTYLLKNHLSEVEKYYDYILIDVPPGSTMLMINGIVAAENIIVPLDSGIFAYETMETLRILLRDISEELRFMDLIPPENLTAAVDDFIRLLRGRINLIKEIPIKRKDGSVFWADVTGNFIALAGKSYLMAAFRDITERKRMEAKLKEEMKDIKVINDLAVGRELKMIELEKEINALLKELGRNPKYVEL